MKPVELTAKVTIDPSSIKPLLVKFFKRHASIRKARIFMLAFGAIGGLVLVLMGSVESYNLAVVSFIACVCLAFALPRFQAAGFANALRQIVASDGTMQSIEVTAEMLTTPLSGSCATYKLKSIHSIECAEDIAVLQIRRMQFFFIPGTADFGPETFESFVEKLKALHSAARESEPS